MLYYIRKERKDYYMEQLKNYIESVNSLPITISGKNIKQNERNALKADFINALFSELKNAESDLMDIGMTTDGIALNIQNQEIGSFVIVLNATIKNLEYDFDFEVEEHAKETVEKQEKKQKKEEEKKKKIEETERMRAKKKAEKERKSSEN